MQRLHVKMSSGLHTGIGTRRDARYMRTRPVLLGTPGKWYIIDIFMGPTSRVVLVVIIASLSRLMP